MRPAEFWPATRQPKTKIEKYQAGRPGSALRSPMPTRQAAETSELGRPQRQIPRGSSEGNPTSYGGGSFTPDQLRGIIDAIERLEWVEQFKAFLRRHTDPRDQGAEAATPDGAVPSMPSPVYNWSGGATPGGDNAQPPLPPKLRHMGGGPKEPIERPYPWRHPNQGTHCYSAASHPGSTAGPLAERYALQRQVAELEDNGQPHLDHGERRRLLAMAGVADEKYRDSRKYDSDRARKYAEMNGCSYETALFRLGIPEPAPLVPIGH